MNNYAIHKSHKFSIIATLSKNHQMKYLPYENVTFESKLNKEEIMKRISGMIEPSRTYRKFIAGRGGQKPYEGSIYLNIFNMSRVIAYRNSFLPIIEGRVEEDFGTTKINVRMRLNTFVLVFICIWCGGVGIGFFAMLTYSIGTGRFEPATLITLGMLLFGYALVTLGFKYESIKSKNFLKDLFDTETKAKF